MNVAYFTPASARRALDRVRPEAERILRIYRMLERRHPLRNRPEEVVEPAYFRLLVRLHEALERLTEKGVRVRDPKQGLVDFPALRAGREVWLCWKVGEETVRYWHDREAGFAGRRPIDEDGPWGEVRVEAKMPG
jgi:hypothetical protein